MVVQRKKPGADSKMLQQQTGMTGILSGDKIDGLQYCQGALRDVAEIADRRRDDVELALRILRRIVLFHCFVRIADLKLNIHQKNHWIQYGTFKIFRL